MSLVLFENISPGIGKITFNRPAKLNALNFELAKDFNEIVQSLRLNETLKVIILTGAGRAFSAGGDYEMLSACLEKAQVANQSDMLTFYESFLSILNLNIPLIAAVHGDAIGGGLCLACACDLRVVAVDAKLGLAFSKLGLHPGMGGTLFLPRLVGYAKASELLLAAKVISGNEAKEIGLANYAEEADQVFKKSLELAEEIAGVSKVANKLCLQSLRPESILLRKVLQNEALLQSKTYAGEDFRIGLKAVMEKEVPKFIS